METRYEELKLAQRGATVSIISYLILAALKIGVGYWAGSEALSADGINNTTDIIASVAVLIGLRIARKPVDEDHQYGHFRAETIASLIASLIMISVGFNVLYQAFDSVVHFKADAPDMVAAATGLFCSLMIYFVAMYNKRLAKRIHSQGLMAAAKDNLSDAWVGIGTVVGIVASQFGLPWIDPLAAVIVGFLIIKTGWDIFREATHSLTDGFDKEFLDKIEAQVDKVEGVEVVKQIRARHQGNAVLMDIIVGVDPTMTVVESHKITEEVEFMLDEKFSITEAIIHVEPVDC